MGIGATILAAIVAGAMIAAIVYIAYLTIKKLKQFIQKRIEQKKKSKVAFGETRKIVDEYAKKILANAPSITMDELEQYCEDTPYFVIDYDSNTDEVSDYTSIKTDGVDERVDELMYDNDGVVLFE